MWGGVLVSCVNAKESTVSPNGNLTVHFSIKDDAEIIGGMFWSVDYKGKTVMEDSRLGFSLLNMPSMEGGFNIVDIKRSKHKGTWKPLYGEQSEIRDDYSQMQISVKDNQTPSRKLTLTFRVYDEGVAMRTTFPKQKAFDELTIESENTQFRFLGDHMAWTTRMAQGKYEKTNLSQLDPKREYERPFVMKASDGTYLAILEAGLVDYARMRIGRDQHAPDAVVSRLSGSATIKAPYSTPWRLLMVADSPSMLLQHNYLLPSLSPPNAIADTSWIKPGKQMREVTITRDGGRALVDMAEKLGLDYLEIDAGWYGDERDEASDATTVTPTRSRGNFTLDELKEVVSYAKSKEIGVIVYVNRRHLEKQLDELLPLYKKWGIAGIKFGFVQVGSQEWTKWLHDSIAKCAEYEMLVDVHDEYRPTGVERMLPNFLTAEGICGNEERPTPKEDLDTAFLRGLCGPADFTMCWHAPSLKLSWAHQMAASVVYYSPLQTLYWYDTPGTFSGDEEYLEFFRALPTVWDQKQVVQGEIGEFITLARRKGDSWFVGTMNAVKQRQVDVPLSFLTPGKKYTATIYSDATPDVEVIISQEKGTEEGIGSKALKIKTMAVTSKTVIPANMANNGGQAIHIVPAVK